MDPLKLLLKSYWGSSGWKSPVFSAAEEKMMLDANLSKPATRMTHDEALSWALEIGSKVSRMSVANAFLYSLSSRKLEYRSPLGSFSHLQHLEKHEFQTTGNFKSHNCKTCGLVNESKDPINFSVLSFEKYKWGGVRHSNLIYMAYDLEQFLAIGTVVPKEEDYKILASILKTAKESKNFTALKKNISKLIKSNDSEREALCEILAYAGILQPHDYPSYIHSFVEWHIREDEHPRSDMDYPLSCWQGNDYVDAAVSYWFPEIREYF